MVDPKATKLDGSLWTTPTSRAADLEALKGNAIDPTASAETISAALDDVKDRAKAFSGRVSEEALRTGVD